MVTTLEIDEKLLKEALALGKHSTASLVIETALKDYIQRYKQQQILDLFGTIEYEENYNYKQQRISKNCSSYMIF
jgi:metal-responsive CopG/Arc/MetJ family transcriptional regulator